MRLVVRVLTVLSTAASAAAASVDSDLGGVANPLPELESVAAGLRLGMELLSLQQPMHEHAGLLSFLEPDVQRQILDKRECGTKFRNGHILTLKFDKDIVRRQDATIFI